MANQDWSDRFIAHLEKLRDQDDRRALALLRRGVGRQPGTVPEMYSLVIPWIPQTQYKAESWTLEEASFLVASLFALHSQTGGRGTLGSAFAVLVVRNPESKESVERRFVTLLNCHRDDLSNHLRQAVNLLQSKEIPVNWGQLLRDVLGWHYESRSVQRSWAREFWRTIEQTANVAEPDEKAVKP